ncbi:MAG: TadE/TadG family type IV pilus assembly protein [Gemmatimonas sp.]
MLARLRRQLLRFAQDRDGATLAEFAATAPILIMLLLAGVDVARLSLLQQKLDRTSASIGDMVAQGQTITAAQMNDIFQSVAIILEPFSTVPGIVIVTSVGASNGNPAAINWQRSGGGSLVATSHIGTPGQPPTLPPGFVVRDGETVIIAEAVYNFAPWFLPDTIVPRQVYHRAMYRPRLGSLNTIS